MDIFKTTPRINFLKYKYAALILTGVIILAGIINVAFFDGLKLGVDFGEGTLLRVLFKSSVPVGDVRGRLGEAGLGGSAIQETGDNGREYQIRTVQTGAPATDEEQLEAHQRLADQVIAALRGEEDRAAAGSGRIDLNTAETPGLAGLLEPAFPGRGTELARAAIAARVERGIIADYAELSEAGLPAEAIDVLKEKTYLGNLTVLSRESVGPQVGKDLRRKAVQAVVWSLLGMLAYIAVRFKFEYGLAAIFTLAQDILITMSIYTFTGREINLPIIAAVLTIVGYSINDTIVIFDRVRENTRTLRRMPLEEIMNVSLNQTLNRTLITSGTLFLTLLALFLFGGPVINDFAFIMLVGTIEGIYSTIALALPVVLFYQRVFKTKTGFRK